MDKQDKFVKVSIRDHGVGISPERIATLFSAGQTTYGTNNEEGSGLGLQLCQDFARKNGGDVMVESVLGEGSTFSVFVPLMPEEAWWLPQTNIIIDNACKIRKKIVLLQPQS